MKKETIFEKIRKENLNDKDKMKEYLEEKKNFST